MSVSAEEVLQIIKIFGFTKKLLQINIRFIFQEKIYKTDELIGEIHRKK